MKNVLEEAYNNYHKYFVYEKVNNKYKGITYRNFIKKSIYLANYLLSNNLKDKNIILYSENSVNLMIADVSVLSFVGISVNVSEHYTSKELIDVINKLDISCIIYSDSKKEEIDIIQNIYKDITYISLQSDFDKCIKKGKLITSDDIFDIEARDREVCSKIVFSSGTTSRPKAVMLSIKNILAGWNSLKRRVDLNSSDVDYLYLPLNHTYANIYNFLYAFKSGMSIYLCSDIKVLAEEILEVKPTLFCSVPYVYIKYAESAKDKLKYVFGPNIKYLFAGGAKLDKELKELYLENGHFIMDAYALSETASSLAISYNDNIIDDSVGTIFEDIEVRISDEGEILVRGDNVFLGYAKDDELTNKVIDKDGFFHTGDLGYIKNNKLYFEGRIKKLLITSKGENIDTDKIKGIITGLLNDISEINLYIENDKVSCDIYLKNNKKVDTNKLLESINSKLLKFEKINKLIVKEDNRLKK